MKLFCLPYAGSSAVIYEKWKKRLAPSAVCIPMELAGRGTRTREPFYMGMADAAADMLERLKAHMDGTPYALFGHSMGGMIMYEVCHLIRAQGLQPPAMLFFSGRPAPEVPRREAPSHELPDDEFAQRILDIGATSAELFANQQLRDIFMPILRADFRLIETYKYEDRGPLPWPITAIAGIDEVWTEAELEAWNGHTSAGCQIVRMEGGHFYLQDNAEPLLMLLQSRLAQDSSMETMFA
ncbi:alpha/beta fold hydrolase [Paenibacillus oenotherae]|uniref:Alpha/beta fold hydrolase n=1 Tax=Paenibacillus oenotherae TaxID=1435645 RepID=A0ABS7DA34_9BACL|nr:alpha/beta fold hydrolase [Paenibacillus oenotherae]MBW7476451.1 alpha/beta fold hydrolase [Paenibacillus oenotherae]